MDGDSIPTWAAPLISDGAYVRAKVDSLAGDLTAVRSEVDRMQGAQIPMSEHTQLVSDVRSMRDSFLVWKALVSWASVASTAAAGAWVGHIAGWIR